MGVELPVTKLFLGFAQRKLAESNEVMINFAEYRSPFPLASSPMRVSSHHSPSFRSPSHEKVLKWDSTINKSNKKNRNNNSVFNRLSAESKAVVAQKLFVLSYNYTRKRDYVLKGGYFHKWRSNSVLGYFTNKIRSINDKNSENITAMAAEYNSIMSTTIDNYESKIITLNQNYASETEKMVSNHNNLIETLTITHKNENDKLINENKMKYNTLVRRVYQKSVVVLCRILIRLLKKKAWNKLQQMAKQSLRHETTMHLEHLTKSYEEQINQLSNEKAKLQQMYTERLNEYIVIENENNVQNQEIDIYQMDVKVSKTLVCQRLCQLYAKSNNGIPVVLRSFHRWKQFLLGKLFEDRLNAAKTEVETMQRKVSESDLVIDALEVDIYREMRRIVPKFVAPYLPIMANKFIDLIPNSTSATMDRRFVAPDSNQEKEWVVHMSRELRQVALKNLRLYQTMKCIRKNNAIIEDISLLTDEFSIQERIEDISEEVTKVMQLLETHKSYYYHITTKHESESAGTQYGAFVNNL